MNRNKVLSIVLIVLLVMTAVSFFEEQSLTQEEKLIEEINFGSDATNDVDKLYLYEEYEPDIYFCMGTTVSDKIYVGFKQIKNFGITTHGASSLTFTLSAMFSKSYYCLEKTQEEGKFYFGFVQDMGIESVSINGESVSVKYFDYPGSRENKFGFWFMKADWNYSINEYINN